MYLSDILMQLNVQNDIRFAIVDAFEAEGIEIPFPQRDIHVRSGLFRAQGPDETPMDEEPADETEEEQDDMPTGRRRRRRKVDPE